MSKGKNDRQAKPWVLDARAGRGSRVTLWTKEQSGRRCPESKELRENETRSRSQWAGGSSVPKPSESRENGVKIDRAFIEQNRSVRGGWNEKQLRALGVEWPPKKGWIKWVERMDYPQSAIDIFVTAGKEVPPRPAPPIRHKKPRRKAPVFQPVYAPKVPLTTVATDAFLDTYEWRRIRMTILKRDGARCACCGATPADGVRMHVDHIKPRRIFPALALDPKNLQVLCELCNHGKGNWDMTDWRSETVKPLKRSILGEK